MNFTKSKDGILRADILVPFRIGRNDLINVICWRIGNQEEIFGEDNSLIVDTKNEFTSTSKLLEALKSELAYESRSELSCWYGHCYKSLNTNEQDIIQSYATRIVNILFPQLCPPKNQQ